MNQSLLYHLYSCHVGLETVGEKLNYSLKLTLIIVCFNELYLLSETSILLFKQLIWCFAALSGQRRACSGYSNFVAWFSQLFLIYEKRFPSNLALSWQDFTLWNVFVLGFF